VLYELALEPLEFSLAAAATQIALPGRPEHARSRITIFALTGQTTTTIPPRYETQRVSTEEDNDGYPSWLINEMVSLGDPGLEDQRAAVLIADAEERKRQRLELEQIRAAQADASSGLPTASQAVLTDTPPSLDTRGATDPPATGSSTLDLDNATCRHVVANAAGEVVGELLGDCIRLGASTPLLNAVELCLPVMYDTHLENTPQARVTGVTFDFARKEVVPETYNTSTPPPLAESVGSVPGRLGSVLWLWASGPHYGRLQPGWALHSPLGLQASLRSGRGGVQLCAKVFEAGWTYCPIARLAGNVFAPLSNTALEEEEEGGAEGGAGNDGKDESEGALLLDSSCPGLDATLSAVQGRQVLDNRTSAPYKPVDMQVSDVEALLRHSQQGAVSQSFPVETGVAVCPTDQCLAMRGREFWVVSKSAADCMLHC